jgi:hypothetical protein
MKTQIKDSANNLPDEDFFEPGLYVIGVEN